MAVLYVRYGQKTVVVDIHEFVLGHGRELVDFLRLCEQDDTSDEPQYHDDSTLSTDGELVSSSSKDDFSETDEQKLMDLSQQKSAS